MLQERLATAAAWRAVARGRAGALRGPGAARPKVLAVKVAGAMRRSVAALLAFAAAPIEWAEPSRDVAAYAGGSLDIAWRPRSGARIGFEEWEAFLSLDGGAH